MAKALILAALCLVSGAILGSGVSRFLAQRHQHTRAVMWLAQFHLERAEAAAREHQCQYLIEQRVRLQNLYEELIQAFASEYAADAQFRARADALQKAVLSGADPTLECADPLAAVRRIRDACDDCHRQFRS
jgi:hypothetical protein